MTSRLDRLISGFGLSFAIASIANAALVIAKGTSEGFRDALKSLAGHQWMSHGAVVLGLFLVLGFVLSSGPVGVRVSLDARKTCAVVVAGALLSALAIIAFYLLQVFT